MVQGYLDPKDRSLDEAFRIIDSIGWAYTVMHVHPFCPRVVREFISNHLMMKVFLFRDTCSSLALR